MATTNNHFWPFANVYRMSTVFFRTIDTRWNDLLYRYCTVFIHFTSNNGDQAFLGDITHTFLLRVGLVLWAKRKVSSGGLSLKCGVTLLATHFPETAKMKTLVRRKCIPSWSPLCIGTRWTCKQASHRIMVVCCSRKSESFITIYAVTQ